jgi:hypothetical protein
VGVDKDVRNDYFTFMNYNNILFEDTDDMFDDSKWDYLDDDFANAPTVEKIGRSRDPVGSLTDHRRSVAPNRNGAYNRRDRSHKEMWGN